MPSIEIRTEIPGPRSRAWIERKERVVADAKALWVPVFVESAEGALVTDVDGNTFIDFAGGIGCLAVGHSNPAVTSAVQTQVARFLHTDFTIMPYDSYVELAEQLCRRLPITGPTKAAFFNSGAEAVENAVKIAKAATGRPAVIAFEGAFHGRTHMAMSLTSKQHPYKAGFGPFAPEVYRVAYPYEYRWPGGGDPSAEAPTHVDVRLVGPDHEALVQVAVDLGVDRGRDGLEAVPRVLAADPAGEVDVFVAVDVDDGGAVGAVDDESWSRHAARDPAGPLLEDAAGGRVLPHGHRGDSPCATPAVTTARVARSGRCILAGLSSPSPNRSPCDPIRPRLRLAAMSNRSAEAC